MIGNVRKFVRVPSKEVYENLLYFIRYDLNVSDIKSEEGPMSMSGRLKGAIKAIWVTVRIRILPENEASTIELNFSYRSFIITAFVSLIAMILLSVAFLSAVPLFGIILLLLLMYNLGATSKAFMASISKFLLLLETKRAQDLLAASRKRWQADSRRIEDIHQRLLDAHAKVWGDAHVLEYKISEYVREGLTMEEAIRKIAEDEGVF